MHLRVDPFVVPPAPSGNKQAIGRHVDAHKTVSQLKKKPIKKYKKLPFKKIHQPDHR
jgi:hypothetical protein